MLTNTIINRKATKRIAEAVQPLKENFVFVGGAIVSLYINDPAAEDIRPTKDIDKTFEIVPVSHLELLQQKLTAVGFNQTAEDNVICRFRYEDIKVDVMSTQPVGWAPSNIWFKPGLENAVVFELDNLKIQILPLPFFLATKMEALFDRGIKDIYVSSDLEDIVYLLNYTTDIVEQVLSAEKKVKAYLQQRFTEMISNKEIYNAMPGSLYYEQVEERMKVILDRIQKIINGD